MSDDQCLILVDHLANDSEFGILQSEYAWISNQTTKFLEKTGRRLVRITHASPIMESQRWRVSCEYENVKSKETKENEK